MPNPPSSTEGYLPAGRHSSAAGGKRLTPRNLKAAATRERIIAAAAAAFDERGYLGVNLREVVQDLGLTTGALYYFFKTKEDLAVEIVERHFAGWDDLVAEVVAHSTSRLDALVEVTYRVADAFTSDLVVRAGARLSAEREVIGAELHRPYADWTTRLASLLDEATAAGEVRADLDSHATAEVVIATFFGAQAITRSLGDPAGLRRRLDTFWELTLPSMRAVSRSPARPKARAEGSSRR